MSKTTIEDPLEHARRRIDRLQVFAHIGAAADASRIRRHLDALHREESSVLAAAPNEAEARAAEDEARGRPRTHCSQTSPKSGRRSRPPSRTSSAAGTPPRAAADDGRRTGGSCAPAGRGGDCRRPRATDRGLRPPRAGARDVNGAWHEQRNHVSAARDARTARGRAVGEVELKGRDEPGRTSARGRARVCPHLEGHGCAACSSRSPSSSSSGRTSD